MQLISFQHTSNFVFVPSFHFLKFNLFLKIKLLKNFEVDIFLLNLDLINHNYASKEKSWKKFIHKNQIAKSFKFPMFTAEIEMKPSHPFQP
jgi:hypothetical protein